MANRFKDDQSPAYKQAVAALTDLLEHEDEDSARRAYAEAISDYDKALYAETRKVRESNRRYQCVHALLGKRCPAGRDPYDEVCPPWPGQDHVSTWNKDGKLHIVVSQPYGMDYETLKELVAYCEEWKLQASIESLMSWHFPGYTLLVEFYRQGSKRSE